MAKGKKFADPSEYEYILIKDDLNKENQSGLKGILISATFKAVTNLFMVTQKYKGMSDMTNPEVYGYFLNHLNTWLRPTKNKDEMYAKTSCNFLFALNGIESILTTREDGQKSVFHYGDTLHNNSKRLKPMGMNAYYERVASANNPKKKYSRNYERLNYILRLSLSM